MGRGWGFGDQPDRPGPLHISSRTRRLQSGPVSALNNPVMWRVETVLAARKGARGPVNFGSGAGPGPFAHFGGPSRVQGSYRRAR